MALSARGFPGAPGDFRGAYGLRFQTGTGYLIFADLNSDHEYSDGEQVGPTTTLQSGITISGISPSSPLTVIFYPPDPFVVFNSNPNFSSSTITISDGSHTKNIITNRAGLIYVQ